MPRHTRSNRPYQVCWATCLVTFTASILNALYVAFTEATFAFNATSGPDLDSNIAADSFGKENFDHAFEGMDSYVAANIIDV